MAKGKWQMENHLKFAICLLPFDLLVSLHEPAARGWGLRKNPFGLSFRGVFMGLWPTQLNENHCGRHPRESGGPHQSKSWIPAFAGMTGTVTFKRAVNLAG